MTSPRKKRLRTIFTFLAALLLIDLTFHAFHDTWMRHSPDEYTERIQGCAQEPREVVFLGGSTVAEGLDPEQICRFTFNGQNYTNGYAIGLAGGTTSDFYFALRKACPTPPKMIVYGMTASDINDNRHEPHAAYSIMEWNDVQDWRRTRPEAGDWILRRYLRGQAMKASGTYRYRHGFRMFCAKTLQEEIRGTCPESYLEAKRFHDQAEKLANGRGYAPTLYWWNRKYSDMKADGWTAPPFEYLARYKTGSHLKYLHRLLDWADEHGTEVVLLDMPVTADLEQRHAKEFAEYRAHLAEVVKTRRVTYLNMHRDVVRLNDDHFADIIHLNRTGANMLSTWLKHTFGLRETQRSTSAQKTD
jgi:hypothetical protein